MEYGGGWAGGGGGGFMAGTSQAGGGGGYNNSMYGDGGGANDGASPGNAQGGGGGGKPNREKQTCTPLTVRMIHNATQAHPDGKFTIDELEMSQVKIVGFIRDIHATSTHTVYVIEDGTGLMECQQYQDQNESPQEIERRERLLTYVYVRVYGTIRTFQEKYQINVSITSIRPIDDLNEITYHGLSVIHSHLLRTKGPIGGPPAAAANAGGASFRQPQFGASPMQQPQFNGGGPGAFTPKQQQVLECFMNCDGDAGVSLDVAIQRLANSHTPAEVKEIVHYLASEGHVYSTVDENHYRSTS